MGYPDSLLPVFSGNFGADKMTIVLDHAFFLHFLKIAVNAAAVKAHRFRDGSQGRGLFVAAVILIGKMDNLFHQFRIFFSHLISPPFSIRDSCPVSVPVL